MIVGAVVMMLVLFGIVQWTKIGKAMRAVSEDKEAAELMGIDVDNIIVFTFGLGGASAGAAGVLYTLLFPVVNFYMGFYPRDQSLYRGGPGRHWQRAWSFPGSHHPGFA